MNRFPSAKCSHPSGYGKVDQRPLATHEPVCPPGIIAVVERPSRGVRTLFHDECATRAWKRLCWPIKLSTVCIHGRIQPLRADSGWGVRPKPTQKVLHPRFSSWCRGAHGRVLGQRNGLDDRRLARVAVRHRCMSRCRLSSLRTCKYCVPLVPHNRRLAASCMCKSPTRDLNKSTSYSADRGRDVDEQDGELKMAWL